jgi:hypothetical protein
LSGNGTGPFHRYRRDVKKFVRDVQRNGGLEASTDAWMLEKTESKYNALFKAVKFSIETPGIGTQSRCHPTGPITEPVEHLSFAGGTKKLTIE